jgi:hypothetical protein
MAPIFVAIICALISFTIAAGVIGREAHRLDSFSPVPVYDVEQAVAFVAERLPEDVSSRRISRRPGSLRLVAGVPRGSGAGPPGRAAGGGL